MDIILINNRLIDRYGKDFLNQPIYRVVWSDDQLEKRLSDFDDYVPGTNVLIRRVREVREVKKYPFLDSQWVLEKLFFNQHNTEILDNQTLSPRTCTYEPVWCFGFDEKKRAKRPIWRAIEFLILSLNNPTKLTPSQMNDAELKQAYEDEKVMLELLNTHIKSDSFTSSIKDGDTVILDKTSMWEQEKK